MESLTPFAQMPTTPEPIIAQVQRQLADDPRHGAMVSTTVLDRLADRAVRELWESRVKTFVPVLALRQARELLHDQGMVIGAERPQTSGTGDAATTGFLQAAWLRPDVLHLDADVLRLEDGDVQHR